MSDQSSLNSMLSYIDNPQNIQSFINRLGQAVAIPSVSGQSEHRDDVKAMGAWLNTQLNEVGVTTKLVDLGTQSLDGETLDLPPLVVGRIGDDPKKKTVLVYGHYDVQPAAKEDGWFTDSPFTLVPEPDGRLVGRGSTDDKGPVLGWVNVLEAHKAQGLELPVNMRFCFEGMEESGSVGLDDFIKSEAAAGAAGWFAGVSCVCISDNYWLNTRTPCVTYGVRGAVTFSAKVTGPTHDLHSGIFGGMVHEPMTDLILLMSKLVAPDGTILVPGVKDMVPPPDQTEIDLYKALDYTIADLDESTGAHIGLSDDVVELLMGRMRWPSLSLHGIEGAYAGQGIKTIIPASVSGKFSIRTVTEQTPDAVAQLVHDYVVAEFAKIDTRNTLDFQTLDKADAWVENYQHWNYQAAIAATKAVYPDKHAPDLTREGGSIPIALTFSNALNVNVLLLPMGRGDDGAHSTNEKLDTSNFIQGSQLLGTAVVNINVSGKLQQPGFMGRPGGSTSYYLPIANSVRVNSSQAAQPRQRIPTSYAAAVRDDWDDDDDDDAAAAEASEDHRKLWDEANQRAPMPQVVIAGSSTSGAAALSPPPAALQPVLRILKRPSASGSATPSSTSSGTSSPAPSAAGGGLSASNSYAEREARYQAARERIFGDSAVPDSRKAEAKKKAGSAASADIKGAGAEATSVPVQIAREPKGPPSGARDGGAVASGGNIGQNGDSRGFTSRRGKKRGVKP
ncbi:hypothetical protein BD413DRAFT_614581 [Trametes elegans]|nr:hypothetical protein BD413DRAFT_614581 [Trametes elegans]